MTVGDSYGSMTATYNLTDNQNMATYNINCSGSDIASAYGVAETTINGDGGTTFFLTQPVNFIITIAESGGPINLDGLDVAVDAIVVNTAIYDSSRTFAGRLPSGTFMLAEAWGLAQGDSSPPVSESGTDSIAITFTAVTPIPEPSTMALIVIPAVFALRRRHRSLE